MKHSPRASPPEIVERNARNPPPSNIRMHPIHTVKCNPSPPPLFFFFFDSSLIRSKRFRNANVPRETRFIAAEKKMARQKHCTEQRAIGLGSCGIRSCSTRNVPI
ncbi:hypothetical protein CDAR_397361 [Caerostris darwini]|uniref:Uncharacterized protein n=1 Tax=Caerostris darwini TaxID=1538125 RepID=A0AAV4SZ20_9ARAC|nr:hypothetical protein CDAR_397361 [Caerostris darwini]